MFMCFCCRLIAAVFRLGQLEVKAFQAGLVEHLSPQVTESLVGFMSRWAATYLLFDESYYSKVRLSDGHGCSGRGWRRWHPLTFLHKMFHYSSFC